MARRLATFVLGFVFLGLFFPATGLAVEKQYAVEWGNQAGKLEYDGLVPCGKCLKVVEPIGDLAGSVTEEQQYLQSVTKQNCDTEDLTEKIYLDCQLCHLFIMLDDLITFVLINIIPPLAILMIIVGGVMFYLGGARPELVGRGRKLVVGVVIGLFLIYGAYMIVGTLLKVVGAAEFGPASKVFKDGVFSIKCPVRIEKTIP